MFIFIYLVQGYLPYYIVMVVMFNLPKIEAKKIHSSM
jgi:hypothetical protein